jgi:DNA-directed RNA polymerase subunit M/transcription elongation factor TFIIS
MNVLIVDLDKVSIDILSAFVDKAAEIMNDDIVVLPKGVNILQDVPLEWLKDIRDKLDEKIRELDKDTLYCPLCGANHQYIVGEVMTNGDKVVAMIYRCDQCKHVWEVNVNGENINCEN